MYAENNNLEILTTRNKPLFLRRKFNGCAASDDKIATVFNRTQYAANLLSVLYGKPVISTQTKNKLLELIP